MKKINSIIALLSLAAALSSCDFLNRDPSDRITEQEVFSKIETAEQYLNNAYAFLPDFQTSTEDDQGRYKLGGGTDEIGYQQSSTVTQTPYDFNLGNWNPTAMPMQRNWADYYGCIRRCNVLIKNYDLIPEEMSTGTSNRKERLLGEAYRLRGYSYFLLFMQWHNDLHNSRHMDPIKSLALMYNVFRSFNQWNLRIKLSSLKASVIIIIYITNKSFFI